MEISVGLLLALIVFAFMLGMLVALVLALSAIIRLRK